MIRNAGNLGKTIHSFLCIAIERERMSLSRREAEESNPEHNLEMIDVDGGSSRKARNTSMSHHECSEESGTMQQKLQILIVSRSAKLRSFFLGDSSISFWIFAVYLLAIVEF
jgi:hypothetical protein